jgi:hypothetical protein
MLISQLYISRVKDSSVDRGPRTSRTTGGLQSRIHLVVTPCTQAIMSSKLRSIFVSKTNIILQRTISTDHSTTNPAGVDLPNNHDRSSEASDAVSAWKSSEDTKLTKSMTSEVRNLDSGSDMCLYSLLSSLARTDSPNCLIPS